MSVKIEKGVPYPDGHEWRGGNKKRVLEKMEVGDSFRVEQRDATAWKSAANNYSNESRKFSVRVFADAYRLWRTK